MLNPSSTADIITPSESLRDPWSLLVDQLQDLILTTLADEHGVSPADLPSLYLAKSVFVSGEKRGDLSYMLFDLHVKDQAQAKDVYLLRLRFGVNPIFTFTTEAESC